MGRQHSRPHAGTRQRCAILRGPPGSLGGYTLECEGADPTGTAKLSVSALFVTLKDVISASVLVSPIPWDGTITDLEIAPRILLPVSELVAGSDGSAWVRRNMDDAACHSGCVGVFRSVHFEFHVGVDGSRFLDATPAAMP